MNEGQQHGFAEIRPEWSRARGLVNGLFELVKHAIGAASILGFIKLIEKTMEMLWGTEDKLFFDHLRVKYIFQCSDLFLLIGFTVIGSYKFLKAFFKE